MADTDLKVNMAADLNQATVVDMVIPVMEAVQIQEMLAEQDLQELLEVPEHQLQLWVLHFPVEQAVTPAQEILVIQEILVLQVLAVGVLMAAEVEQGSQVTLAPTSAAVAVVDLDRVDQEILEDNMIKIKMSKLLLCTITILIGALVVLEGEMEGLAVMALTASTPPLGH